MSDHHPAMHRFELPILAVQDENATIVILETAWGVQETGSSKREPGDQKDYARGYRLALARALVNLGHELQRQERQAITAQNAAATAERTQVTLSAGAAPSGDIREVAEHIAWVESLRNIPEAVAKRHERWMRRHLNETRSGQ